MSMREKRRALLKQATDVINLAKSEDRDLTRREQVTVEGVFAEIDDLDKRIAEAEKSGEAMRRIEGLGSTSLPEDLAEQKSALLKAYRTKQPVQVQVPRKSLTTTGLSLLPGAPQVVGANVANAVVALRDLFRQESTESPVVRYYTVGATSGGPGIVGEGELKPEMQNVITAEDGQMVKLAGRFVHTTEFDEDAEWLAVEILNQAVLALIARENKLVVDTMAGASGVVTATGAKADALEVIASAIGGQESLNGVTPSAIVLHPTDYAAIRMAKSTGSGEYVVGDPLSAAPPGLLGIPVKSTPAVAAGTVWLTRPEAGVFYQRKACTITSMPSNDDFDHNRVTTIIEERVLPAITQPSLLTRITLT